MTTHDNKPEDFLAIALWGECHKSAPWYIENQMRRAAYDRAPLDALYKRTEPGDDHAAKWVCVSDLNPGHPVLVAYRRQMQPRRITVRAVTAPDGTVTTEHYIEESKS